MNQEPACIRPGLLIGLCLATVCFVSPSLAAAQSKLRVDSDRIDIPDSLDVAWQKVIAHSNWSSTETGELGTDAGFSRFLPRNYEFKQTAGTGIHVVTRWFTRDNCVSTDRSPSTLGHERRTALEKALDRSLDDIADALKDNPAAQQPVTVLWCQFRTASRELVPFDELSETDRQLLKPFADLALKHLDLAIGPEADCDSGRSPRVRPRQSSSRNRSQGTGPGATASGSGLSSSGVSGIPSGTTGSRPNRPDAVDQKFPVLVERFESFPGSLQFEKTRELNLCIRARSSQEALARARTRFPASIARGDGLRISFRVSPGGGSDCGNSQGSASGSSNDDGDPETTTKESGDASGENENASSGLSPMPDPIGMDAPDSAYGTDSEEFLDPYAFDDIPYPGDDDSYYPAGDAPKLATEPGSTPPGPAP